MGKKLNSLSKIEEKLDLLKKEEIKLKEIISDKQDNLEKIRSSLYETTQRYFCILKIHHIGSIQLPRLQGREYGELSEKDIIELDKLINRSKTLEGLVNIIEALKELKKYYPHDIKTNLYGLLQKIIIEGAYTKTRQKKGPF
jgi:hypothetical protein